MNITEIWTNPKFSMSAMVRRMADRELDEAMRRAAKQAHADSLSETMIDVIRMDRELAKKVDDAAHIAERLTKDFHEMFPDSGDAA